MCGRGITRFKQKSWTCARVQEAGQMAPKTNGDTNKNTIIDQQAVFSPTDVASLTLTLTLTLGVLKVWPLLDHTGPSTGILFYYFFCWFFFLCTHAFTAGGIAINRCGVVFKFWKPLLFQRHTFVSWSESSFSGEGGKEGRTDWRRDRAVRTRLSYLRFAVIGLCVDAVVAVHFDLNRIRLERLFSIFFLQRQLPVKGAERKRHG